MLRHTCAYTQDGQGKLHGSGQSSGHRTGNLSDRGRDWSPIEKNSKKASLSWVNHSAKRELSVINSFMDDKSAKDRD